VTPSENKRPSIKSEVAQVIGFYVGYIGLGWFLAGNGMMAVLLSPSGTPSIGAVFLAMAYVLMRLFALLILPGLIVARVGMWVAQRWLLKTDRYQPGEDPSKDTSSTSRQSY